MYAIIAPWRMVKMALRAIGRFNTLLIFSIFYIGIIGPTALVRRLRHLFTFPKTSVLPGSYWQKKEEGGFDAGRLRNQF